MPIYISRGCYTADAVRGMMAAPEDREPSIAGVFEKLGGKLLCYYVTLGEFDWLLIAEFPDEMAASSGTRRHGRRQHQQCSDNGGHDLQAGTGSFRRGRQGSQIVQKRR
jgi:GYD domain